MKKIYTKKGDKGYTTFYSNEKIPKTNLRLHCNGELDELLAFIGLLKSNLKKGITNFLILKTIQDHLLKITTEIADVSKRLNQEIFSINEDDVFFLEDQIDSINEKLPPLKQFIIAGKNQPSALAHVCRTITRRVERSLFTLHSQEPLNEMILQYINRLSDFFFVLARELENPTQ